MAVQRIVVTAGDAAQHLERIEGDGFRLMGVDQLPEVLLAALEAAKGRLPRLAGLPLEKTQHAPAVIAGLHTGADKTGITRGQALGLHR